MVLNPSDYSVDPTKGNYNPLDVGTYKRVAGFAIAATMVLYAYFMARNRLLPLMNSVLGNVGLSSQGGNIEVFE